MFWEIHKENHEKELDQISNYLLSFFKFAASSSSHKFIKEEWLLFQKDGNFLYEKYESMHDNAKTLKSSVDDLFHKTVFQRQNIYEAILHDLSFEKLKNNEFKFRTIILEEDEQSIIKKFFIYFYDVVFYSAKFDFNALPVDYGRKNFVESYFKGKNQNLEHVCPVCLQTTTIAKKEEDIEHYFPKKQIPCLALHPINLYFICSACNQRYKNTKNPIGKDEDIRNIFLPYIDTVKDQVTLNFVNEEQKDSIRLIPCGKGQKEIEVKIEGFNQLFDLENRWSELLMHYFYKKVLEYSVLNFEGVEEIRSELEKDAKKLRASLSVNPNGYIETKYIEWILQSQLKAFCSNLLQKDTNVVIL